MLIYYYPASGLINGILAIILGLFVLTRNPADRRYITYALFCLSLFIWSCGYFFWLVSSTEANALFWTKILVAGAVFIPVTAYHHVIQLIGISTKPKVRLIMLGYLLSVSLFFLSPTSILVSGISPKLNFPYWPNPGVGFHLHFLMFVFFACKSVSELYQAHKTSIGRRRNHLRMLLITIALAFLGGGTNYLLWYDIPVPPFGNILIAFYIAIFAYAIFTYQLMDIEFIVKKSLIYAFLLGVLLVPCYIVIIWAQVVFFGKVSPTFSLISLILLILVGFLFPKLRFRMEEAFEQVLFKKRYNHREILLRSSREMISVVDLETLCQNLVQTVSRALGVGRISLFLIDEVKGTFSLRASLGLVSDRLKEFTLARDDQLVRRFMRRSEAVVREELEMANNGYGEKELVRRMGEIEAEVSLPLTSKESLKGILNLGHKDRRQMYSEEELEVLSTLANQAAIAIDNAQLYENLKQSQSIIHRANRLSSLGMLTAGLAHEIRNPLVAIRTFTQLLPERYADIEFRESFQSIALKEVDRICGLVNDLLSFARPSTPKVSRGDVNEIVEAITRILSTEAKEKGVTVNLRLAASLPKILVDKEQLKQVSMNVILNAIQSIENKGVVEISSRLFLKDNRERFIQIEVRDTGIGIPEGDMENIFNPFFTTKEDGSGLGLSISHQIVKEHGGYMAVESKVGVGTSFYINLPASQVDYRRAIDSPQIHEKDFGS